MGGQSVNYYIAGYGIISAGSVLGLLVVDMFTVWVGFRGAVRIHDRMVACLLSAPVAVKKKIRTNGFSFFKIALWLCV